MRQDVYKGVLKWEDGIPCLINKDGSFLLKGETIWDGYRLQWENQPVRARFLPQKDYVTDKPIVIVWPDAPPSPEPFVEIYYNERLVKYWASTFGHNAINVDGEIFNFSHLLNENEAMTPEEFFYRPALGEFAPSPTTGGFATNEDGRDYFDKFGRNFMRSIHVLQIEGVDTDRLANIYHRELEKIHNTPVNPAKPDKYPDFSFINRSCTTIIRDGLLKYGFTGIKGFLPRDFFISAAYAAFNSQAEMGIKVSFFKMPQLLVPEAQPSKMTPLFNPVNWFKLKKLQARE